MKKDNKNESNKEQIKKPSPAPTLPKKLNRKTWTNYMNETAKLYD